MNFMQIAIHESLVPSNSAELLFTAAAAAGADGVVIDAAGLDGRIEAIAAAARAHGVRVAALDYGRQGALLHPDVPTREHALDLLRANIGAAVDLQAAGVLVVPHYGAYHLPDLFPWKSSGELHAELLHMHLRTLSDFCYALGASLFIQTTPPDQTAFISRLEQAYAVVKRIKHPNVMMAVDCAALLAEANPAEALSQYGRGMAIVLLPATLIDHAPLDVLRQIAFDGWIVLTGSAGNLPDDAVARVRAAFPA
jgi:sugar phosphate isomerase/epimerase